MRLKEAELIQDFIARARQMEPQGLVVLGDIESTRELYLEDGDTIFIPAKSNLVTVAGEVKKPNSFPFVPGMTLTSVIAQAGGMTPLAIRWEVKLVRKTKSGTVDAIVDYDAINKNEIKDVPLQPGDNITVPRSPF